MAGLLGTIAGQVRLDIRQAVAGYATLRAENAKTLYALRGSADAFIAAGKGMVAAGAGLLFIFGEGIKKAADFEKKLDFFQAVTDSDAKSMKKLGDYILELSTNSIFSADEIAAGFVELGKAGVDAKDIIAGIGQAVLSLGAAGDISLQESGNVLTSIIQTFNLKASSATSIADQLAGAANSSIVEITDLAYSMKYAGGVANALGIHFGSVNTALALLGKAGIKGSTAGTSLRQIMVSLAGATGPATAELKTLGIITEDGSNKFFTAAGEAKQLSQVFQILQDATKGLTKQQKLSALRTIFNNRALAAAAILTGKGAKGFQQMAKEIGKVTALDVAHKRLDNLSGDLKKLKANIDAVFIKAGTPFQNSIRGFVQGITHLIKKFSELSPKIQEQIFKMIGISGATLVALGTFSLFLGAALRFIARMKELGLALKFLLRSMPFVVTGVEALAVALGVTVSVAAAIVIAVILILIGAFIAAYHYSQDFRNAADATGRALVVAAKAIGVALIAIGKWFKLLWEDPAAAWAQLKKVTREGVDYVAAWVRDKLPGLLWKGLQLAIKYLLQFSAYVYHIFMEYVPPAALAGLKLLLSFVWAQLQKLPGLGLKALGLLGQVVLWGLKKLGNYAKSLGAAFVKLLIAEIKRLPYQVGFIIGFMVGRALRLLAGLVVKAGKKGQQIEKAITRELQRLPGQVGALFVAMARRVLSGISQAVSAAIHNAPRIARGVISGIIHLPAQVGNVIHRVVGVILNLIPAAIAGAIRFGAGIKNGLQVALFGLPGIVWDILGKVIGVFKEVLVAGYQAALNFAKGLWEGFKSGLGIGSPSYIEYAMWDLEDNVRESTKRLSKTVLKVQKLSKEAKKTRFEFGGPTVPTIGDFVRMHNATNTSRRLFGASSAGTGKMPIAQQPKQINFEITSVNPKKERTSDAVQKGLTRVLMMGLLDGLDN